VVVVGADLEDGAGVDRGAAYLFEMPNVGDPCTVAADCTIGWCADDVCCNTPCGEGDPVDNLACSITAGATTDGQCEALE
jgi:hypothetical protein